MNILSGETLRQYQDLFYAGQPVFIKGDAHIVSFLQQFSFFQSAKDFLTYWTGTVDVFLPDLGDEQSSKVCSTQEAWQCFTEGRPLLVNDVNQHIDELAASMEDLKHALKLPHLTYGRNLVYMTPQGAGNTVHFDQNMNFVFQVSGKKQWWLRENHSVKNPLSRHVLGTELDYELGSYLERPLPNMIDGEEHYILEPGDMLFVPRGWWHRTLANEDGLSLNYTFTIPSYLDLYLAALRGRLTQDVRWRQDVILNGQEAEHLDQLLTELTVEMAHVHGDDIFSVTEGPRD